MAKPAIDEARVARVLAVMEANIEQQIRNERIAMREMYIPGVTKPVVKVDRSAQQALSKELSMDERMEVGRRCRAIARAFWEDGDEDRKNAWGGW
jgi:hypothetical protein